RSNGTELTYDPRRLRGVAVYREGEREFAEGDRVQFTAPSKELHVANRELGTIAELDNAHAITIRTDSGRVLRFNVEDHPHLDYGYAVTSHSSQGQTADRVLIHVDTEKSEKLVNSRMAYVSISRARHDVEIYTDNRLELGRRLERDSSQRTAIGHDREHDQQAEFRSESHSSSHAHGNDAGSTAAGESQGQSAGHGHATGEGVEEGIGE
ncbi:MAG TPA: ATP-binding domain-containing protein, partial [Candidatus Angelobacter sp.]|nr:ATP-binding domain-containing protein [Candidatus Angelobacter sp.]